jgi:hypothetical protein
MAEYTVPDYWQDAVDATVSKIQTLQNGMGVNCVNFAFFTDIHYDSRSADSQYTNELGNVVAAVMDECNIPLAVNGGDTSQATSASSEQGVADDFGNVSEVLSPIDSTKLLTANGNHDAVWGSANNRVSASALWNLSHRGNALDLRRVVGGDGSYYYVDNVTQKTRFIVLNTSYYETATTGGWIYNLGVEQVEWLANKALITGKDTFDGHGNVIRSDDKLSGWSVVIIMHVPPLTVTAINGTKYGNTVTNIAQFVGVVKAYCNKTAYSNSNISVDYRNVETAEIVAVFSGHTHTDDIVTSDLPCPVIITNCASNKSYDEDNNYTRTKGTNTETVVDFVSIDKTNGIVYLTRLGAGVDRQCAYR